MIHSKIDLRSDTLTRPTEAMLRVMSEADYGDDCFNENKSVKELEEFCSDLFGKEESVLMPSGTMSNQVALKVLVERGHEVVCEAGYHLNFFEASPTAELGGVTVNTVQTLDGVLTPEIIDEAIDQRARWTPAYAESRLLWTENTINGHSGRVYPLHTLESVREWSRPRGLSVFMDGARIMNAVVATGVPPIEWGRTNDAMAVCFAKGLGAPMGSILMGSADFICGARHYRKWYGGALHQSGPIAAAGMWALKNNRERLADDHVHATGFSKRLAETGLVNVNQPDSNIVLFDVGLLDRDAVKFVQMADQEGIQLLRWRGNKVRAVFSLGVTASEADEAGRVVAKLVERIGPRTSRLVGAGPALD